MQNKDFVNHVRPQRSHVWTIVFWLLVAVAVSVSTGCSYRSTREVELEMQAKAKQQSIAYADMLQAEEGVKRASRSKHKIDAMRREGFAADGTRPIDCNKTISASQDWVCLAGALDIDATFDRF